MIRRPRSPVPKTPSLAEAQAEFTAEGAPAPGKVSTRVPAMPPATNAAAAPRKASNARKGPAPAGRHRW